MSRSFTARKRPLFAVFCSVLALAASSCGGSEPAPEPPRILDATADRVVTDGAATLSSVVTIRFNRPVALTDDASEEASGVTIEVVEEGGNGFVIPPVSATSMRESPSSSRLIEVTTNGLVPDGSIIRIDPRTLVDGGATTHEIDIRGELVGGDVILASVTLRFSDLEAATRSATVVPTEADRDNDAVRLFLLEHLALRSALGSNVTPDVLTLYDQFPRDIIPHPKVRAALAALFGTFAQSAITSFLTSQNCSGAPVEFIDFRIPPGSPNLLAEMSYNEDGQRLVSLHPMTEGDRFEHLMPLLAHEAVHCDRDNSVPEEIASAAFDTYLYTILLALDPSLAQQATPLARNLNVDVLALANSGRIVPESVGVLQSFGVDRVVPGGSSTARSFAEHIAIAYSSLEPESGVTERVAGEYVTQIAGATDLATGPPFDLTYLDDLLGSALPRAVLLEAILALQLVPR